MSVRITWYSVNVSYIIVFLARSYINFYFFGEEFPLVVSAFQMLQLLK